MCHRSRWTFLRTLFAAVSAAAVLLAAPPASAVGLRVSSFLGGADQDRIQDAAVGADGSIYLAGATESADFPGGEAGDREAAFVVRLDPQGQERLFTQIFDSSEVDSAEGVAVDDLGNVYLAGFTEGRDFPVRDALQDEMSCNLQGCRDAWVAKLDASGEVQFSTFLGGRDADRALDLALGPHGRIYVAGGTESAFFPFVRGIERSLGVFPIREAFLTVFENDGREIFYSTSLGGGDSVDEATAVAVDARGAAYLAGGALPAGNQPRFFPTHAADGGEPFQSLTAGGSDGFVAKIDPEKDRNDSLIYSTFLGGSFDDFPNGIAVDAEGRAYVAGGTFSSSFPVLQAVQPEHAGGGLDAFVSVLNANGSGLVKSTFLGGRGGESAQDVTLDPRGVIWTTGFTASQDFPTVRPIQARHAGRADAFVTSFGLGVSALPTFAFSTYLGGTGSDQGAAIAPARGASILVAGATALDFPVTEKAFQDNPADGDDGLFDGFFARLITANPDTVGVFVAERNFFQLRNSNNEGPPNFTVNAPPPGGQPIFGDFDGNGIDTVGTFRDIAFLLNRTNQNGLGGFQTAAIDPDGLEGDIGLLGDWDGDGDSTPAVFRNGLWRITNELVGGEPFEVTFGVAGDLPVAGDWDGDGLDTIGIWTPATATFRLANSLGEPRVDVEQVFGDPTDRPVAGDWDGDGDDSFGVFRDGIWILSNSVDVPTVDLQFLFGAPGDLPVVGDWDGLP